MKIAKSFFDDQQDHVLDGYTVHAAAMYKAIMENEENFHTAFDYCVSKLLLKQSAFERIIGNTRVLPYCSMTSII